MSEEPVRRVLIALPGDTSPGIAIDPAVFDTAPIGPNGESYAALGWQLVAYEDTREPYEAPPDPPVRAARQARAEPAPAPPPDAPTP